ncbi:MAG: DUF3224 domain-containing protein [Pyrinomonadaceae bacterium]
MSCASGSFVVTLTLQPSQDESSVGRFVIEKQFHGELEGTSNGEMLAVRTNVEDSAGYVAMEQVSGKLNGRSGTLALQHNGLMTRGTPQLSLLSCRIPVLINLAVWQERWTSRLSTGTFVRI